MSASNSQPEDGSHHDEMEGCHQTHLHQENLQMSQNNGLPSPDVESPSGHDLFVECQLPHTGEEEIPVPDDLPELELQHVPEQVLLAVNQQIVQHVSVPQQCGQQGSPNPQQNPYQPGLSNNQQPHQAPNPSSQVLHPSTQQSLPTYQHPHQISKQQLMQPILPYPHQQPIQQQLSSSFQHSNQQMLYPPWQNVHPNPQCFPQQSTLQAAGPSSHLSGPPLGAVSNHQHAAPTMTQPYQMMMHPYNGHANLPSTSAQDGEQQPLSVTTRDQYDVRGDQTSFQGGQTNIGGNVHVHLNQPLSGQDTSFDAEKCKKHLKANYKNKRKCIGFLPGMPKEFDIEEFFVELALLSEENRPSGTIQQKLTKYTDLLTLKNRRGREEKHVLVRGDAGTGKTTLVSRLAYQWAVQDDDTESENTESELQKFKLLFALDIRKFTSGMDLPDVIIDQLLPLESKQVLERFLAENGNSCLFLFDGYDEFCTDTNLFSSHHLLDAHVVITTRPGEVGKFVTRNEGYIHVSLDGFSDDSVAKFISLFFSSSKSNNTALEDRESMTKTLNSSPFLKSLSHYPLLLTMMCLLWKQDGDLPKSMTSLYEQAVEYLGRHWMVKFQIEHGMEFHDYAQFKEQVAMETILIKLGKKALQELLLDPRPDLINQACGVLSNKLMFDESDFESPDLITQASSLGLIHKESVYPGFDEVCELSFIHKSFQEFCAAKFLKHLAELDHPLFISILHVLIPEYGYFCITALQRVLQFCCGMSAKSAEIIFCAVINMWYRTPQRNCKSCPNVDSVRNCFLISCVFEADLSSETPNPVLHKYMDKITRFDILPFLNPIYPISNSYFTVVGMLSHSGRAIAEFYVNKYSDHPNQVHQTWLANISEVTLEMPPFQHFHFMDDNMIVDQFLGIMPNMKTVHLLGNDLTKLKHYMRDFKTVITEVRKKKRKRMTRADQLVTSGYDIIRHSIRYAQHMCNAFLRTQNMIEHLRIEDISFAMDSLTCFLLSEKQLKHLQLIGNCMSEQDISHLFKALDSSSVLYLEVGQNPLSDSVLLCPELYHRLRELSLPYAQMNTELCKQLFGIFVKRGKELHSQHSSAKLPLQKLDMSWNNIGDSVTTLVQAFKYMEDLHHLDLSATDLVDRHILILSSGLDCVPNLKYISLAGCQLGNAVGQCMKDLRELRTLKICSIFPHAGSEECSTEQMKNKCAQIYHPETIELIEKRKSPKSNTTVFFNPLCAQGTIMVCKYLQCAPLLTNLDLSGNAMRSEGAFALCNVLHEVPLLERLNLNRNNIEEDGIVKLAKSFHHIPQLQALFVGSGNASIGASSANVFLQNLAYLPEFNKLSMPHVVASEEEIQQEPLRSCWDMIKPRQVSVSQSTGEVLAKIRKMMLQGGVASKQTSSKEAEANILESDKVKNVISHVKNFHDLW